ncbi:MAG TPA: Xaa-Pro aminopeptidase [Candidatus Nanoarchaeia archaeon]|nr:Xaa-Pro aminopeptidase [Candidatus Nanoarchaeia archaeon]
MIPPSEYSARRERLMRMFSADDCIIFLQGDAGGNRNPDVPLEPRQNSFVRYLAPLNGVGYSIMLVPKENKFILFAPENTRDDIVWKGRRPDFEELKHLYGADEVHSPKKISEIAIAYNPRNVYSLKGSNGDFRYFRDEDLAKALVGMRLIKSEDEVREIEKALEITSKTYDAMFRLTRPGRNMKDLLGALRMIYYMNDATHSFMPIITNRADVLHLEEIKGVLKSGDLALYDTGAELIESGYGSDITRTAAANGKFTPEQLDIYNIVLQAQIEAIAMLKPGVNYRDVHFHAEKIVAQGLKDMGILKGSLNDILANGAHRLFFRHGLGHHVGLDDHDCGGPYADIAAGYDESNPRSERFGIDKLRFAGTVKPGMVLTAEPGTYRLTEFKDDNELLDDHKIYVDFGKAEKIMALVPGVRIEDCVYITEFGPVVLGPNIPKTVIGLEGIVGAGDSYLEKAIERYKI